MIPGHPYQKIAVVAEICDTSLQPLLGAPQSALEKHSSSVESLLTNMYPSVYIGNGLGKKT